MSLTNLSYTLDNDEITISYMTQDDIYSIVWTDKVIKNEHKMQYKDFVEFMDYVIYHKSYSISSLVNGSCNIILQDINDTTISISLHKQITNLSLLERCDKMQKQIDRLNKMAFHSDSNFSTISIATGYDGEYMLRFPNKPIKIWATERAFNNDDKGYYCIDAQQSYRYNSSMQYLQCTEIVLGTYNTSLFQNLPYALEHIVIYCKPDLSYCNMSKLFENLQFIKYINKNTLPNLKKLTLSHVKFIKNDFVKLLLETSIINLNIIGPNSISDYSSIQDKINFTFN
jgi:hypothetical protein